MNFSESMVLYEVRKAPIVSLFIGFSIFFVIVLINGFYHVSPQGIGLIALFYLLLSILINTKIFGLSLIEGTQFFLLLLFLFHFGVILALFIPGVNWEFLFKFLEGNNEEFAISLALLSLVIFEIGVGLAYLLFPRKNGNRRDLEDLRLSLLLPLAFISAILLVFMAFKYGFFKLTYSESWFLRRYLNTRWFGIALNAFVLTSLISISGLKRNYAVIALVLLLLSVTPLFLFGFRGFFIMTLLVGVILVEKKGRISISRLGPIFLALLLIIPVIKAKRNKDTKKVEGLGPVPVMAIIEMGGTLRTLVRTVDYMEDGEPLWMGKSYLMGFKHIPPNLFIFKRREKEILHPSSWITLISDPVIYMSGGGWGYSIVAEAYLNFGLFGILIIFLLLGFILYMFDTMDFRSSSSLALYALFLYPLFYSVRNDFFNFARPFMWGVAILLLVTMFRIRREYK